LNGRILSYCIDRTFQKDHFFEPVEQSKLAAVTYTKKNHLYHPIKSTPMKASVSVPTSKQDIVSMIGTAYFDRLQDAPNCRVLSMDTCTTATQPQERIARQEKILSIINDALSLVGNQSD
jgi:hypothetical protein